MGLGGNVEASEKPCPPVQKTWTAPEAIEARSMEIIQTEMPEGRWTAGELAVVKRCIHTSADFDYAENLYFSPGAVERALELFGGGTGFTIVTDTNMAASGINKTALKQLGGQVHCFMADPDVAAEAAERGVTRATVSMEHAARLSGPVVFTIGNAPTALIRLHEMIEAGQLHPDFIIAVPVGFVNVVESKELIVKGQVPCIVARGRKGGSNIAAAVCNGLMYQLTRRKSV
ncbi:MAG: precorrin-8X methylmutase [Eubacteriales bacterium]|nr:precorrin-8X methylmutase [Eubacteriales bacterium]